MPHRQYKARVETRGRASTHRTQRAVLGISVYAVSGTCFGNVE
jgi:hypothetical protein